MAELASVEDDVQRAAVLSLQGFTTGAAEDMVTDTPLNPEEMLLHRERIGYLHDAVAVLPERLRFVVEASFLQERPLAEVAAELGVTESRVSQLRTEALALLRDGLSTHLDRQGPRRRRRGRLRGAPPRRVRRADRRPQHDGVPAGGHRRTGHARPVGRVSCPNPRDLGVVVAHMPVP